MQSNKKELDSSKQSLDFWINLMKDSPIETRFPYDEKRPSQPSGFASREPIIIDELLSDKLKLISEKNNISILTTLLTAFGVLINYYSYDEDICIGAPLADHSISSSDKIIFRLKIDRDCSFNDILQNNKQAILNSLNQQGFSFEKLVDIIQPERIFNVNPFFQIMFAWQNTPRQQIDRNEIELQQTSKIDLTLYLCEDHNRLEGEIEFNVDILNRESIIHLKHNFLKLIEEITTNSEEPIGHYTCSSDYSINSLKLFNHTDIEVPKVLLHEMFENAVIKFPNKTAVIFGNKQLTYKELNKSANKLANYLINRNVKNQIIGICLNRSEQLIINILAVLKAGACYLPLDPDFPDDRINFFIKDSGAEIIITTTNLKSKLSKIESEIICLDKMGLKFHLNSTRNPEIINDKDSLSYIMYTSGSTGNPKGVKIPHNAVVNFINSMAKKPGISVEDKLLAVTSPSFDISVLEFFLPISIGATTIIAANSDLNNSLSIIKLIEDNDITVLQATPATFNILLLSGWNGKKNLKALCGGEAIQPSLIKELFPKVKEMWNMYGPTETTVWSTCHKITDANMPVLVGKPINNTQIYILTHDNRPLPQGIYGEVAIGGESVAKGYHNREELTSEKFITGPINKTIYKTGDWGRIKTDGTIELSGRIDNQIKIRGYRIEPGEIETIIGRENGIKEVIVKAQYFSEIDIRLIAFFTSSSNIQINTEYLKSAISDKLPDYMVPSFFVQLYDFPKTPNGKIDKKALLFDLSDFKEINTQNNEGLTDIQERILNIWQDVIKTKSIRLTDNFFYIGGNSLLAIAVAERIEKEFNLKFNLKLFFDNPVIQNIAEYIEQNVKYFDLKKKQDTTSSKYITGEL